MVDSVYRTRSLGVAAEGLPDQYADGKAAKVWEYYIGCKQTRTNAYKSFLLKHLKDLGCKSILDVACGTGVDSITLVEEGFNVVSTDASDKMLKYALKERWNRRKEPHFDDWVIDEANWLTLKDDLEDIDIQPASFDAVLCLGNSFAHLPDFEGDQSQHIVALTNFRDMVKPGGVLMIDHRNYDAILDTGHVPKKNIYYNSDHIVDIKCSNLYVDGHAKMTTFDYVMDMSITSTSNPIKDPAIRRLSTEYSRHQFRLSYYPHRLEQFKELLGGVFPKDAQITTYADFEPADQVDNPGYYVHLVRKPETQHEA